VYGRDARTSIKKQPHNPNHMKTFFLKTRIFWVISRILFIALYIGAALNDVKSDIFVAMLFFPVSVIMIYVAVVEFLNKDKFIGAKVLLGVFSIFMGVIMAGLILYMGIEKPTELFLFLLPLWVIMYGLWEIFSSTNR
jgi:hypothetical protein